MKRPSGSPEEDNRPKKQLHIDLENNYFHNEAEISPSELPRLAPALPEDKFIVGEVFMDWPSCRISIRTASRNLEIAFSKAAFSRLSFIKKNKVCISLKGANLKHVDGAGPSRYPFNLVYKHGAIVKFMASEKRHEEIVNAYEPPNDTDAWFLSSQTSLPNLPDFSASYPKKDPTPEVVAMPETTNDAARLESTAHPNVLEIISENTEADRQLGNTKYMESPASSHQGVRKSSSLMADKKSANRPALASISQEPRTADSEKAPTIQRRTKKEKRMKKRDTRHVRAKESHSTKSHRSINEHEADVALTNKIEEQARQALHSAEAVKDKCMHPPRDSGLDLVAGFTSEKGEIYQAIGSLQFNQNNSFVGIVTDAGPIKSTRNGDCSKSFVLVDPSQHETGITVVTFAHPERKHLLPSAKAGQALLFRNVWINQWCGRAQAVGYKETFSWCGYDPSQGKHFYSASEAGSSSSTTGQSSESNIFHKLSQSELDYFVRLSDWRCARIEAEQQSKDEGNQIICLDSVRLRKQRPTVTISEMKPGVFVDCVAQLLQTGDAGLVFVTAYITDYTENVLLEDYMPPSSFPSGRRTLKVALWDVAKTMADDLEPGAFYLFENIRLKKPFDYLEGNIGWGDSEYISKISVNADHESVNDIIRRKQVYEKNPNASKLRSDSPDIQPFGTSSVPEPICQAHTVRKEDTDADDDEAAVLGSASEPVQSIEGVLQCSHIEQKYSTVQQVQASLRCPNKFLLRCRIVEFYPLDVKDFIRAKCPKCNAEIDMEKYDLCPSCGDMDGSLTIYYQFALRIIDESSKTLDIAVHGREAEDLLRGLSAADARDDVAALKVRLCPLIGHIYSWHETLDEVEKKAGPWVSLSVFSWTGEPPKEERLYKLFDCHLPM